MDSFVNEYTSRWPNDVRLETSSDNLLNGVSLIFMLDFALHCEILIYGCDRDELLAC